VVPNGTGKTVSKSWTHARINWANELSAISGTGADWVDPTLDSAGNMVSGPRCGSETTQRDYKYDAWNRTVSVKEGATVVAGFGYDGLHRRIAKTAGNVVTDYYFNESWQVVETAKTSGGSTWTKEQFVWDTRYIDAAVLRWRDSDDDGSHTLEERRFALQDANWNVTGIVGTDGAVVERYIYSPYGMRTILTDAWGSRGTSTCDWTVGHQGLFIDGETGLIQNRERILDPLLGRFMQRDPLGYVDAGSLYEYVRSGPICGRDPLGRSALGEFLYGDGTVIVSETCAEVTRIALLDGQSGLWSGGTVANVSYNPVDAIAIQDPKGNTTIYKITDNVTMLIECCRKPGGQLDINFKGQQTGIFGGMTDVTARPGGWPPAPPRVINPVDHGPANLVKSRPAPPRPSTRPSTTAPSTQPTTVPRKP
jgi:RHS repeat-associated protein